MMASPFLNAKRSRNRLKDREILHAQALQHLELPQPVAFAGIEKVPVDQDAILGPLQRCIVVGKQVLIVDLVPALRSRSENPAGSVRPGGC